jgi:hypothetical protein
MTRVELIAIAEEQRGVTRVELVATAEGQRCRG